MVANEYDTNLRHMAEPAAPADREEAVSVTLADHEALYLAGVLIEWSHYMTGDEERSSIGQGYVEYINRQVRGREKRHVTLYAHTPKAADVLNEAVENYHAEYYEDVPHDYHTEIEATLIDLWLRHNAESVNRDAGREVVENPAPDTDIGETHDGNVTVEVDE